MTDRDAIQEVITLYSQGCSKRDWALVTGLFLPDGAWEVKGHPAIVGRAALEAAMAGFLTRMDWFVQINSPAVIRIHGDTATAESTVREIGRYKDKDEAFEAVGFYADDLVRTGEGWKFARKDFTSAGSQQILLQAGPASIL